MSQNLRTFITLLRPNSMIPSRESDEAVGYDVYSTVTVELKPLKLERIPLGIALCPPEGHYFELCSRSGLTARGMIGLHGTLDPDYRGEVFAILLNTTSKPYTVLERHRVGQLVLRPAVATKFSLSEALPSSNRGTAGFGSTGT